MNLKKAKLMEKVKELLKLRQLFASYGQVWDLQEVNYQLVGLAEKLGMDYYSL